MSGITTKKNSILIMLIIEQKMIDAINGGYNWELNNTCVIHSKKQICVFLHNNLIAALDKKSGNWEFSCCGWHTATTRSRLKALGCDCKIKNFRFVGVDSHIIKLAW